MKVFLTGATGFIGGEVARRLAARGDEVRALVRDPARASGLPVTVVQGDLSDAAALERGMAGCDAVVHCAAVYEMGIPRSARERMRQANVEGSAAVFEAVLAQDVPRLVYVSTVVANGRTRGAIADEAWVHDGEGYGSYYERTKHEAHVLAERLISERGLPAIVIQPGGVYGPGDHSTIGEVVRRMAAGKLPAMLFGDLGITLVHRDDVADGIVRALDHGRPGERYVLGGDNVEMDEVAATVARLVGRRPPRLRIPSAVLLVLSPFGRLLGPLMGLNPNFRELVSSSAGQTYYADNAKARRELGYAPRSLEDGIRDTLVGEGLLPEATQPPSEAPAPT